MQIRDFTEVLEAGLSAADVAVIPPGYDSVTIGDIERTRLNHIRILFFIGVNDGIIPKAANAGGIISEYERELLAEKVELAPGAREQAFIQRFYLYRNLTKPSEKLYVSYAKVDSEGKAIRPSYLTGVLRKLFPTLKLQEPEHMEAHTDFIPKRLPKIISSSDRTKKPGMRLPAGSCRRMICKSRRRSVNFCMRRIHGMRESQSAGRLHLHYTEDIRTEVLRGWNGLLPVHMHIFCNTG